MSYSIIIKTMHNEYNEIQNRMYTEQWDIIATRLQDYNEKST